MSIVCAEEFDPWSMVPRLHKKFGTRVQLSDILLQSLQSACGMGYHFVAFDFYEEKFYY